MVELHFQSGDTFTGLAAGTYSIVSCRWFRMPRNNFGNTYTVAGITLNGKSSTTTDPSCGRNDGSIVTSVSGGTGPYIFSNDGGIELSMQVLAPILFR